MEDTKDVGLLDQHDIMLHFDKEGQRIYIDPEVQQVLSALVEQNGSIVVKVNWHSPDLFIFAVPTQLAPVTGETIRLNTRPVFKASES